jgi:hypothetical protein
VESRQSQFGQFEGDGDLGSGFTLPSQSLPVRRADDIDAAFTGMRKARIAALIADVDATMMAQRMRVASMAVASRIPTIFGLREFVDAGGLMSYGPVCATSIDKPRRK